MSFLNVKVNSESPKSNYVSYNKFNLSEIPLISITKYFLESTENLYFLALALFQLLTYEKIGILPTYWSPSGPFSTMIPLLLCYLLEVFNLLVTYFTDLYKTYKYNYRKYVKVLRNDSIEHICLKNIKVGDILIVNTDEIIPVDTVLAFVDSNEYAEISLSNLNGESDIICKDGILTNLEENIVLNITFRDIVDFSNSIKKFKATCIINDVSQELNNNYFIPGGSINKGNVCTLIVTQIGKSIRSYTSNKNEKLFKQNFIDNYITDSLTNYFILLLAFFTFSITIFKNKDLCLFNMLKTFVQSWILLNGVVPFSAKIIVMTNRSIQSYLKSDDKVDYIHSNSIDNFTNINKVICDKTGTITKNELSLTHISFNKKVIERLHDDTILPFNLIYQILLSLHYKKNSVYSTEEDRVISDKIISLGTIIEQNKNKVYIKNKIENVAVDIIEMDKLQFDCNRKMSSVIYKNNNRHFIITKGSIEAIGKIIKNKEDFIVESNIYDTDYPYLRTIAIAFKEILYDEETNPHTYEESGNYTYITILGIQDDLQDNIENTVSNLYYNSKKTISICTGDRYETALYIGNSLNVIKDNIIDCECKNIKETDLSNSTFIFSSIDIAKALKNEYYMDKFTHLLLNTNNFVSFAMIPKDKQFVTSIFEMRNINTISVGDGNNDIPMLKCATVGVGVKNGLNSNVVNNSQITITSFSDLSKVQADSEFCYNHNYNSIYSVFYKIIMVHCLVFLFINNNNYDLNNVLFNFVEIQGNHLLWGILPVFVANLQKPNIMIIDKDYIVRISIIVASLNSLLIMKVKEYQLFDICIKRFILFLSILSINLQYIFIFGMNTTNIIACLMSMTIGFYYVFYI